MKKKIVKNAAVLCAFLLTVSIFTSCNRNGYGCPYELEIPVQVIKCAIR